MSPPSMPAPIMQSYTPPQREDPAIAKAKADELRRQQMERGRAATFLVGGKSTGELLPAGPTGGASVLGV